MENWVRHYGYILTQNVWLKLLGNQVVRHHLQYLDPKIGFQLFYNVQKQDEAHYFITDLFKVVGSGPMAIHYQRPITRWPRANGAMMIICCSCLINGTFWRSTSKCESRQLKAWRWAAISISISCDPFFRLFPTTQLFVHQYQLHWRTHKVPSASCLLIIKFLHTLMYYIKSPLQIQIINSTRCTCTSWSYLICKMFHKIYNFSKNKKFINYLISH